MMIADLIELIKEHLEAIQEAETIGDWQEIYSLGAKIGETVREMEERAWEQWGEEL